MLVTMITPNQEVRPSDPPWLKTMISLLGIRETPGDAATPIIVEMHKWTTLPAKLALSDETSWCSSSVNYCLGKNHFEYTRSAAARSWERYGHELPRLVRGCIVVLSRGPDPKFGHVGFAYDAGNGRTFNLIGGNQDNPGCVSIKPYPLARIVAKRWPLNYPLPTLV